MKRILRYIKGTLGKKLTYYGNEGLVLTCFADADWANDKELRRSVSGIVSQLCGGPVSWRSKMQGCTALSSTEAEYIALAEAGREISYLRQLMKDIGCEQEQATVIWEDTAQTIGLTKNPEHHERNKHIDVRHHYIRDQVQTRKIDLCYKRTSDMLADIFTKPLPRTTFIRLRDMLLRN